MCVQRQSWIPFIVLHGGFIETPAADVTSVPPDYRFQKEEKKGQGLLLFSPFCERGPTISTV